MKRILIILPFILFTLWSCNNDEDNLLLTESGTVVDLTGSGDCGIVIDLDNGTTIQPLYYPEGFSFAAGQRILVQYEKLEKVMTGCGSGIPCDISYVEELSCPSWTVVDSAGIDSLANDPVHVHEAFIDGDCLYIKLSYNGGCSEHTINMVRLANSETNVPAFEIRHNANGDLCEAWLTRELRYDMGALKAEGAEGFTLKAQLLSGETYEKTFELNQE